MAKTRAARERIAKKLAKISTTVPSTCLRGVKYDPNKNLLDLEFRTSGAVYRYDGPSSITVSRLLKAGSKGRFFNRNIRNGYDYERIRSGYRSGRRFKKTR